MKKIIYAILITTTISLAISSCTEEEVRPQTELSNGGGNSIDKGYILDK